MYKLPKPNMPKGDVTFNVWKLTRRTIYGLTALWIIFSSYAGVMWIREWNANNEIVVQAKLISPIAVDAMESEWTK